MKVKIAGINGYLGTILKRQLIANGHVVTGINRSLLYGDIDELQNEIKKCDAIINLAGAPILQRWTKKNRQLIYDSRIKTTTNLVKAINKLKQEERPKKFIAASAIGIYNSGAIHTEKSKDFDSGFVGKVVVDWENALKELPPSILLTTFRIGLVLGKEAKTITKLMLPFKLGLGGKIGSGNQPFPFIHEKDLVSAFVWAIEKHTETGTFNLTAPEKITNKDFTKELARQLIRPAFFLIPDFVLKIIFGEAAVLLLESPVVEPRNLLEAGFQFQYPSIRSALNEIIK